jgi:hypothetical protein
MEILKKTILQALTIAHNATGGTYITGDTNATYCMVIGLVQRARDVGFFDAWIEPVIPEPPIPPVETFYLVDSAGNPVTDDNINDIFLYD